jgi:hypothetical protein
MCRVFFIPPILPYLDGHYSHIAEDAKQAVAADFVSALRSNKGALFADRPSTSGIFTTEDTEIGR